VRAGPVGDDQNRPSAVIDQTEDNTMSKPWNNRAGTGKRRCRLLPVIGMLALGLAGTVATPAGAAANQPVPFSSSISGTLSPTGPTTLALAGTGNASHLGNVKSYQANVVITSGVVGVTDVTDTLTETLASANGDTLTLLCQQTATLNSGVYHGTDQWTVIGGTGRFSNATGSGTGDTYVYLGTSTFTKTSTGAITY
jgi:hypothetical protein